jgi:hypothetical protein
MPDARLAAGVVMPASAAIWAYIMLVIAHYAKQNQPQTLLLALLGLGVQTLLVVGIGLSGRGAAAFAGAAAGWALALLVATFAAGWGATQVRPAHPAEIVLDRPTDFGTLELTAALTELSWQETGAPRNIAFTYVTSPDSPLAWYLRDFHEGTRIDPGVAASHEAGAVHIAPADAGGPEAAVGQDFVLYRHWDLAALSCTWYDDPQCATPISPDDVPVPTGDSAPGCAWYERLNCTAPVRWLLYRWTKTDDVQADTVVLWVPPPPEDTGA